MGIRRKTPDILGDVLSDKPEKQNTIKPEKQNTIKPEEGKDIRIESQDAVGKTKATYYISTDAIDALDEIWFRLRKAAKAGDKGKVSKSLIVEAAIEMIFGNLESEGADNLVARLLEGR